MEKNEDESTKKLNINVSSSHEPEDEDEQEQEGNHYNDRDRDGKEKRLDRKEDSRDDRKSRRSRSYSRDRNRRSRSKDRPKYRSDSRDSRDRGRQGGGSGSSSSSSSRRRSPSPPRRRRSRSRSGDRSRRNRSPSPYSRRDDHRNNHTSNSNSNSNNNHSTKPQSKTIVPLKANKFWDGFQWVDRTPLVAASLPSLLSSDPTKIIGSDGNIDQDLATTAVITSTIGQKDRRIYVGNLPPGVSPDIIKEFINNSLLACNYVLPSGVTSAVLSVWISSDARYAFVELCSAEAATIALALTGINFLGMTLKISRPKTYTGSGSERMVPNYMPM